MKELNLICLSSDLLTTLEALQKLGLVHFRQQNFNTEVEPGLLEKLNHADSAIKILEQFSRENQKANVQVEETIDRIHEIHNQSREIEQQLQNSIKQKKLLEEWPGYDPTRFKQFKDKGLLIKCFKSYKTEFKHLELQEGYIFPVSKSQNHVNAILICKTQDELPQLNWVELGEFSLKTIEKIVYDTSKQLEDLKHELKKHTEAIVEIKNYINQLKSKLKFQEASQQSKQAKEGPWVMLSGYFPQSKQNQLVSGFEHLKIWYEINEVNLEDENIPVKLENNSFNRLFEPITKIFALPRYNDIDPTPFFAPFFVIYFGLCLGDAGYGLILLAITFLIKSKFKSIKAPVTHLLLFLSIASIVSGFLLNTFLGTALNQEQGWLTIPSWMTPFAVQHHAQTNFYPLLPFALFVGFFQLGFGLLLRSMQQYKQHGVNFIFYPFGNILILFACLVYLVKQNFLGLSTFELPFFNLGQFMFVIPGNIAILSGLLGILLVLIFIDPKKGFFPYFGLSGLWGLYQYLTGLIGDILSYLRLFALGLAGGLLGASVNQIALLTIREEGEIHLWSLGLPFCIIILILGHSLNLALASLGAFVHPLRLTFVEFYKSLQFQGGGLNYSPFKRSTDFIKED